MTDPLDAETVRLDCYEPAGLSLSLSVRDLLGHTLVLGSSGAGKSSRVVFPVVAQLIGGGERRGFPVGLCLHDIKADGAAEGFLRSVCAAAGRERDLIVIKPGGPCGIDFLSPLRQGALTGSDAIAGLLAPAVARDPNNTYWEKTFEVLLRQAVRLYALTEERPAYGSFVGFLTSYLVESPLRWDAVKERVRAFGMLCGDGKGPEASVQTEIVATHGMWRDLDHRTGSILRSMAGPLLARLNAPVAHSVFGAEDAVDVAEAVAAGKIVVLSIDGMREPAFARLAGTVFKGQFYDAVLRRAVWRADGDVPLSGLVLDDWALSADGSPRTRHSDTDALAMLRSRGGFVLAGCQSLAGLDLAVGAAARCAALANFNNLVFMRSRDTAVDLLAANYLGERSTALVDRVSRMREEGDVAAREIMRYERETRGPAVPVGALSRLPVGEAYALIGGEVHAQPICLVPFYDPPG